MFNESGAVTRFPSVVTAERPQPAIRREEHAPPGEIFVVLWRRRIWIALGMLFGVIAAATLLATATPHFTAVAQLLIDPETSSFAASSPASLKVGASLTAVIVMDTRAAGESSPC